MRQTTAYRAPGDFHTGGSRQEIDRIVLWAEMQVLFGKIDDAKKGANEARTATDRFFFDDMKDRLKMDLQRIRWKFDDHRKKYRV